jgi:hypothetical protein
MHLKDRRKYQKIQVEGKYLEFFLPYCDSYIISTASISWYLIIIYLLNGNNVQLSYVLERIKMQKVNYHCLIFLWMAVNMDYF